MSRATTLLLIGAGAALLLTSSTITWATAAGSVAGAAVTLDGAACVPGARAVGIVALAGIGGLLAVRGRARMVVGLVLVLASVLGLRSLISALSDGLAGVAAAALPLSLDGTPAAIVDYSWAGPVMAALGFVLVAIGGLVAAFRGVNGRGLSQRFERETTETAAALPAADAGGSDSASLWIALDRGEDPTRHDTARAADAGDVARSSVQDDEAPGDRLEQEADHDGGAR